MSDERPIFARWRYPFAEIEGKKILIIEFFEARHWRLRQGMSVHPSVKDWNGGKLNWSKMYRVRINGRWFGQKKLSFFTMVQAAQIVEQILEVRRIDDNTVLELSQEGKNHVSIGCEHPIWSLPNNAEIRLS